MYGPSLSLHDALPILEVIEHIFPGRDVDRDVGPFIGGNFSKAALLERLAGRHDLDHRGVARIDITLNVADDARRLPRRDQVVEKSLLRWFESCWRRGFGLTIGCRLAGHGDDRLIPRSITIVVYLLVGERG